MRDPRGAKPRPPEPPKDLPKNIEHGGFTAYQRYKCRCLPCQEHIRAYERRYTQIRRKRITEREHGRVATYNHGCRCEHCKAARRSYDRERWEIKQRSQEGRT